VSGVKSFFTFSNNEKNKKASQHLQMNQRHSDQISTPSRRRTPQHKEVNFINSREKKLPKNFAHKILDYELKIDSGRFDLETIDKLM